MLLRISARGASSFNRLLNLADTRILARRASDMMHKTLIDAVALVFEEQGIPRWHPLSEVTLIRRAMLGFGPGPILYRTGELRQSFVDESSNFHIYEMNLGAQRTTIIFGSSLPRAFPLGYGVPEQPLPARPMFPPDRILHPELEGSIIDAGRAI